MTENFSIGDIIIGTIRRKNAALHPIVYLRDAPDSGLFLGAMLTHSSEFGNLKLDDHHFIQKIDADPRPSFFVKNYLLKKEEWGPFRKVGRLSGIGISFMLTQLKGTSPELWEDYI